MKEKSDAARANAEAMFKQPEQPPEERHGDQAVRDRTARLRDQRLAKETIEARAAEIRVQRRRGK